jgi:tetratricopeptide (TPR) repeat protein
MGPDRQRPMDEAERNETRRLPALLPVVAFGGLIAILILAAFLAGGRSARRATRLYVQGDELARAGRHEEAVVVLEEALRQDPDLVPAYCRLAEVLRLLGRPGEAGPHRARCERGAGGEGDGPRGEGREDPAGDPGDRPPS